MTTQHIVYIIAVGSHFAQIHEGKLLRCVCVILPLSVLCHSGVIPCKLGTRSKCARITPPQLKMRLSSAPELLGEVGRLTSDADLLSYVVKVDLSSTLALCRC